MLPLIRACHCAISRHRLHVHWSVVTVSVTVSMIGCYDTQLVLSVLTCLDSVINELLISRVKYIGHQVNLQLLTAIYTYSTM